jgi:DNA-binding LytR/AlgR family response regulator
MPEQVRVLVVDDEPLARLRIEDALAHIEGAVVVGSATNGIEAVERIRTLKPDLVFLDVQMPGKTGVEVIREIGADNMPATIFVTAYDQFAVQAFDVAAVDYLVKPFDDERFEAAFARARQRLSVEGMSKLREQLLTVLQGGPAVAKFMRVHRSMIVRLDLVDTLHRGAGGDYELQLKNGTRVKVSRSRREALERWLGVSE